jgi:hypothetical protein
MKSMRSSSGRIDTHQQPKSISDDCARTSEREFTVNCQPIKFQLRATNALQST